MGKEGKQEVDHAICQPLAALRDTLRRESGLLVGSPELFVSHMHNMLRVDEGGQAFSLPLLEQACQALAERPWLRLDNTPQVNRKAARLILKTGGEVRALRWSPCGGLLAHAGKGAGEIILRQADSGAEQAVLHTGEQHLNALTWHPSRNWLAVGGASGAITLWDAESIAQIRKLKGHDAAVLALSWSPDGGRLASGSEDRTVRNWDVSTGQQAWSAPQHNGAVRAVAWSPNGRWLASAGDDRSVRAWDGDSAAPRGIFQAHLARVDALCWSPDGRLLASGGWDRSVLIWEAGRMLEQALDVLRMAMVKFHMAQEERVQSLDWSPDGSLLAAGLMDGAVNLLESDGFTKQERLLGHTQPVLALSWSPDGAALASGSMDASVCLWIPGSSPPRQEAQRHRGVVTALEFSPDGSMLAEGDNGLSLGEGLIFFRRLKAMSDGLPPPPSLLRLQRNDDFNRMLDENIHNVALPKGQLMLCQVRTGESGVALDHEGGIHTLAWDPDGKTLAIASSLVAEIRLVDVWQGTITGEFAGHTGEQNRSNPAQTLGRGVSSLAWSPDGRTLASGGRDMMVRLWNTGGGGGRVLMGHSGTVVSLAWSPDGVLLASGAEDHSVRLWNAATGKALRTRQGILGGVDMVLQGHDSWVQSLCWLEGGAVLVSAGEDARLLLWDIPGGALCGELMGHMAGVRKLAVSPDGRLLASGGYDQTICLWDWRRGARLVVLPCFSRPGALHFSRDGRMLWVADDGGATDNRPVIYGYEIVNREKFVA